MSHYIEVSAAVRYWDDATVNGVADVGGDLIPFKQGSYWVLVIRLADGMVMEWPTGTAAEVHYKVCDAGEYWLLDSERKRVAEWKGFYVPDDLLANGKGHGDYIILKIGADGLIDGWRKPDVRIASGDDDDGLGWEPLPIADTQTADLFAGQEGGAS